MLIVQVGDSNRFNINTTLQLIEEWTRPPITEIMIIDLENGKEIYGGPFEMKDEAQVNVTDV